MTRALQYTLSVLLLTGVGWGQLCLPPKACSTGVTSLGPDEVLIGPGITQQLCDGGCMNGIVTPPTNTLGKCSTYPAGDGCNTCTSCEGETMGRCTALMCTGILETAKPGAELPSFKACPSHLLREHDGVLTCIDGGGTGAAVEGGGVGEWDSPKPEPMDVPAVFHPEVKETWEDVSGKTLGVVSVPAWYECKDKRRIGPWYSGDGKSHCILFPPQEAK